VYSIFQECLLRMRKETEKGVGVTGAHNLWLPDEASRSLHEWVHHAAATKVRLRPVVLYSRLRPIVETQGGFVGQTSPLYLEFKSHELWRSLEPRGFESLTISTPLASTSAIGTYTY
jgi:hypothetical protein